MDSVSLTHIFVLQIIAKVSVHNRTRTLVKGLQKVTDVKLLTNRVEELSFHLLEFPETRGVAVKVGLFGSLSAPPLSFKTVTDQAPPPPTPPAFFRRACCRVCCACVRPETSPCRLQ